MRVGLKSICALYEFNMSKQRKYGDRISGSGNSISKNLSFLENYKHTDMARALKYIREEGRGDKR